jgi:hypothetical protein
MLKGQRSKFFGQGEGQQKIAGGHLFLELALKPLLTFVVLTVRAITVAAGMWHEGLVFAVLTLGQHDRTLRGPAELHGGQRLALAGQNRVLILRQKFVREGLDDR